MGCRSRRVLTALVAALLLALAGLSSAASHTVQASAADPAPERWGLLIADNMSKRLLITDLDGNLLWQYANPTGKPSIYAGPLGVRWHANGKILATFGSGEVGMIDVDNTRWDWKTSGFNKDWFQSPYDAQLLPGNRLAVATRFNEGGRVAVYDRSTGATVWKTLVSNAHSLIYRTAAESYNTSAPTLIVGGWGTTKELTYQPGRTPRTMWTYQTEYTHDVMPLADGTLLTSEGYYIQKLDRSGAQVWRHNTAEEARRFAPNPTGGFVVSIAHSDTIQFRDDNGAVVRSWSQLSDGTFLNYPYGIRLVDLDAACAASVTSLC